MPTYPGTGQPMTAGVLADGSTVNHLTEHGRSIELHENVKHYGAYGDGSHDDTVAIQAAIDAAMGGAASGSPATTRYGYNSIGKVFLPAGIYKITSPLNITAAWGLTFYGAGPLASKIRVSGSMTQALKLVGVSFSVFRDFGIDGEGGASVTHGISWDWTSALTVNSSSRCRFENITIVDLDFTYGFSIGPDSTSFDVSGTEYINFNIGGNRTLGTVGATHTAGFFIGSGVAGNILNHYFRGCHVLSVKYAFYINNVETVAISNCDSSNVEDFVYKFGQGQVTIRDSRIEDGYRIANSLGGASWTSHLSVENCLFVPGSFGPSDGHAIIWKYAGTVTIKNSTFSRNFAYAAPLDIFVSTDLPGRQIFVHIDGLTVVELGDVEHLVVPAGATHAQVWVEHLAITDSSGAIVLNYGPVSIAYNRDSMLTFGSTQTTGSTGTDQGSQGIRLAHAANAASGSTPIAWATGSTDKWWLYQAAGDTALYLRDMANARMQLSMLPGASSIAAITELNSELRLLGALNHDGTTVGFFGHAPSAQPAAYTVTNPTTDRGLNVTADTLPQVAEVLGTLIADLQTLGIIG